MTDFFTLCNVFKVHPYYSIIHRVVLLERILFLMDAPHLTSTLIR